MSVKDIQIAFDEVDDGRSIRKILVYRLKTEDGWQGWKEVEGQ